MNDDPSPSPAADRGLPPTITDHTSSVTEPSTSPTTTQHAQRPAHRRAQAQAKKKHEFIDGLMTNLDVLIYAELCIVYYMDCSLLRLLLRVLAQMMFLTPKPNFVPPMPQHRPYIGAIFGPNIICMLLHIFTAHSEASEAMRGYLHGGIIIDLIGQKGPTSKLHLVILDMLLCALQCFMLAVHVERERLSAVLAASTLTGVQSNPEQVRVEVAVDQDHDAEERGVVRGNITSDGDIELQAMASTAEERISPNSETSAQVNEERERLLAEPLPLQEAEDDENPLDVFWSGTATVAEFHVLDTLRKQWDDYGSATASALQTVGFSAELAAVTTSRRINAAGTRLQRNMESLGP